MHNHVKNVFSQYLKYKKYSFTYVFFVIFFTCVWIVEEFDKITLCHLNFDKH